MTVRAGMTVQGRYLMQLLLGEGGFGQVWKATDQTLERDVAVKFATSLADDPQAVARFTAEARKLARLRHRGIVTVHDAGTVTDDGRGVPYLVMELLNGSTWQQGGSVEPVESVVRTGAGLAEALAHMHGRGIVHRDVKPANIMICSDGNAVLMDLGLARDFATRSTVTAGVSPGTVAYMAPEQLTGASASTASDIYALGLVLIEKVTGRHGPAAQLPAHDRAALAPHLRALLERMTALDPHERPGAAECRRQLAQSALFRATRPAGPPPRGPAAVTVEEEIVAALAGIVHEIADVPVEDVRPDKSFKKLGVDSLAMIEVVVAAEDRFDIAIPDKDVRNLRTVRDATEYIGRALDSR